MAQNTHDANWLPMLEQKHGAFDPEQREILRCIQLHGCITRKVAHKNGWTWAHMPGLPRPALRALLTRRVVAVRIVTSQPLEESWELRSNADSPAVMAQIAAEFRKQKLKEYAEGGFRLDLRKELRRR